MEEMSDDFVVINDDYHEDDLPQLVASDSVDSIEAIFDAKEDRSEHDNDFNNCSDPMDEYGAEESVVSELSSESGAIRVSYVDHNKEYRPLKQLSKQRQYQSYLCLMPESEVESRVRTPVRSPTSTSLMSHSTHSLLSDFRQLSYEEQRLLRSNWSHELTQIEQEMRELRRNLAKKHEYRRELRRRLGLSTWQTLVDTVTEIGADIHGVVDHNVGNHVKAGLDDAWKTVKRHASLKNVSKENNTNKILSNIDI